MSIPFELDSDGKIITKPVTGWTTAVVAEIAVLLAIQYIDHPQEIETGGKQIQFVLMPQQCLELAEKLTTLAKRVLEPPLDKSPS
jgi:hypothetical protein